MEPETTLSEWVRQHRVTWELATLQELVERRPLVVGFELRLYGQHDPHSGATAGCPRCASLHEKLSAIALAALPKEQRSTRYEVEPFHAALHLRSETRWTPEVQLTVRIVHRDGYLSPLDECERRCADEIQQALRRLGVQPKIWSETRTAANAAAL